MVRKRLPTVLVCGTNLGVMDHLALVLEKAGRLRKHQFLTLANGVPWEFPDERNPGFQVLTVGLDQALGLLKRTDLAVVFIEASKETHLDFIPSEIEPLELARLIKEARPRLPFYLVVDDPLREELQQEFGGRLVDEKSQPEIFVDLLYRHLPPKLVQAILRNHQEMMAKTHT